MRIASSCCPICYVVPIVFGVLLGGIAQVAASLVVKAHAQIVGSQEETGGRTGGIDFGGPAHQVECRIVVVESLLALGLEVKVFELLALFGREFTPGTALMQGTTGQGDTPRHAQQRYRSIFSHAHHPHHNFVQRLFISHPYDRIRRLRVRSRRATRPRPTRPGNTPSPPSGRCVRHPRW